MNEIETLIARQTRPAPSDQLDVQISKLTNRSFRHMQIRMRLKQVALLVTCTAVAGFIGFALGRQSIQPIARADSIAISPAPPPPTPVESPQKRVVITVDATQNDALARFVMPPKQFESLFGNGPLVDRSNSSHLE